MVAVTLHHLKHSARGPAQVALLVATCSPVAAHEVSASAAAAAPSWSLEPWVIACLLASVLAYGVGLFRLWREAGVGHGVTRRQAACFAGGWLVLVLALVSPLDAWGVRLFSLHMLQHELLMVAAAPLFCLSRPLALWVWALPPGARRGIGAALRRPAWRRFWQGLTVLASAWLLHALALWAWHVPRLFDAALHDALIHGAQHASFLATALLFWWSVLEPRSRARQGAALLSLFTTMLHTAALGALLTLAPAAWYPAYESSAARFGLDPLGDQQLGGLLMWAPGGLAYFVAALVLASRWIALPLARRPLAGRGHERRPATLERNRRPLLRPAACCRPCGKTALTGSCPNPRSPNLRSRNPRSLSRKNRNP